MDKIAFANDNERKALFVDAAAKINLSNIIIEKDFWVSWVLEKIFKDEELSKILCFKGGTSLSKAFNLIDRFSEDIDIILSETVVLNSGESLIQPSKNKQEKFNKTIENRAQDYIRTILYKRIEELIGDICSVEPDKDDGHIIFIGFPHVFDYLYIQPKIKLEIGPLALWDPNTLCQISSLIAKALPELKLIDPNVPTIKPERTFWEKITILHQEHHRPATKQPQSRYSRHYYDIYKMANSRVKQHALSDIELLKEVVSFKKQFYPCSWANYDMAVPGTIRLMPANHILKFLAEDYKDMENMIFNNYPSWETILNETQKIEDEINALTVK